ncbi:Na(+)/H(+) antiporter subunit E [Nocardia brasiliensis NBRC 14402]|uniref:Monovalent cation/H+ antiporter subunit E n=1 Tax=Nocardia brasiliensis (strain ATCC 700358 / HUJEG-1) TaxID=1133849 RepID=K0F951_NOCB7|nr:Na+/H+ antiporter subunit E [Nocardia brasiliensis]AFU05880.1 monovalent cation/H+ antiporter subunit E [Nocardia brasiliensis ATCC 700358]ASF11207.1 Na+/H+ antiporter subunit E [Nocardia brasiliensis]GAJ84301.1 Na(+)/H(+) antiporter subunit E [Nocardia brasiliensis NBRC 14402]SUB10086.1 Mrp complex subunit E1 [Nocardia brasiliensis]
MTTQRWQRGVSREGAVRVGVLSWLTVVWIALWGDLSVANLLAGIAVGALIMVALPLPRVPVGGRLHPLSLLQLVFVASYYAIESSVQVAWFAIRPAAPPVSGVLRVYLSTKSDLVLVLCVDLLNLIPGTMVLEIDRRRCVVYVHVLDVSSDEAVDKFYRTTRRLEKLLISSFERHAEWRSSATPPEVLP